jgi:hypothetical protein
MQMLSRRVPALPALFVAALLASGCEGSDVPYVPTPDDVVHKMLEMGRVGPGDVVYDLGSGDGRIVIAAVRDFKAARAVGIEYDGTLIYESTKNAEAASVSDRAKFVQGNIFEADFSEATVLTMYLLTKINLQLRPRILSELKPGTRVVSHQFSMLEWEPDESASIGLRKVYLWIVPAQAAGTWRGTVNGAAFELALTQRFQEVAGAVSMTAGSGPVDIREATLSGDRLRFVARLPQGPRRVDMQFDGRVRGDSLTGTLTVDGRTSNLQATRER